MYITVLDYESGKVIIEQVEDIVDYEDYVSYNYGLDNCHYMTSEKLDLVVLTLKDKYHGTRRFKSPRVLERVQEK